MRCRSLDREAEPLAGNRRIASGVLRFHRIGASDMGDRIKLTSADGFSLNAYKAVPSGKAKGGIGLLQEVWGLNNWIRSEVERYAREGYLCVAPATMDRIEYGFESENYGSDHFAKVG